MNSITRGCFGRGDLPALKKFAYGRVPVAFVLLAFQSRDARSDFQTFFEPHTSALERPACGETIASSQLEDQHGDFFGNFSAFWPTQLIPKWGEPRITRLREIISGLF